MTGWQTNVERDERVAPTLVGVSMRLVSRYRSKVGIGHASAVAMVTKKLVHAL